MGSPLDSVSSMPPTAAPTGGSPSPTPTTPAGVAASAAAARALSASTLAGPRPLSTTPPPTVSAVPARRSSASSASSDDSSISEPTRDAAYYTALLSHAISTFKTKHPTDLQTELAKLPQGERRIVMEGITALSSSKDSDEVKYIKLCNANAILLSKFPIPEEATGARRITTGACNTFANMGSRISSSQLAEAISGAIPGRSSSSANFSSINPREELEQANAILQSLLTQSTAATESIQTTYENTTTQWKSVIETLPKIGNNSGTYTPFQKAYSKFIKKMDLPEPAKQTLANKIREISIPETTVGYNSSLFEACEKVTTLIQKQKDRALKTQQKHHDILQVLSGELALAQEAANRNPIAPTKPDESSVLSYKEAKKNLEAGNKIIRRIETYLTDCTADSDSDSDSDSILLTEARRVAAFINTQYSLLSYKPPAIKTLQHILDTSTDFSAIQSAADTFITTFQSWKSIADDQKRLEAEASRAQAAADRLTIAKKPPTSQSLAAAAPAPAQGKPQSDGTAAAAAPAPALPTLHQATSAFSRPALPNTDDPHTKASTLITQLRTLPNGQWNNIQLAIWKQIPEDRRNQTYGAFYRLATEDSSPIKEGFQTYCNSLPEDQKWKAGEVAFLCIQSSETTKEWNEVRAQAIQTVFSPSFRSDKK